MMSISMSLIKKKVMVILMYVSSISVRPDRRNRIIIIDTLVLNLIHYCIKIWETTNGQKLQSFALRVAFGGVRKYGHIYLVFSELQWLRIKHKYVSLYLKF